MSIDEASVEAGLTDSNISARLSWAERMDWTPTPEQVERELTDKEDSVRMIWSGRYDFSPSELQKVTALLHAIDAAYSELPPHEDFIL